MGKVHDLIETPDPPDEVVQAGLNGDLVFFVGAGVSRLLGLPSWAELAADVFNDLRSAGYLNYSEIEQLIKLDDPKKQLSIAFLIAEDKRFSLNLSKYFTGISEGNSIYKAINDIGCPCVTTNYDELLAPRFVEKNDGSHTAALVKRISSREKFYANLLNEPGTVVHLHGAISDPETMVVTTKQYLEHYDNENVKVFLGELFARKTILFLGYGLEEAEILEHILRRGSVKKTNERKRFALQGFFQSEKPLFCNLHKYYEESFGVHLIGFERDNYNFNCLEPIIRAWAKQIIVRKPSLNDDFNFMNEVLNCE